MMERDGTLVCRVPTREELERRWETLAQNQDGGGNWSIWKDQALEQAEKGMCIPYYGFLGEEIVCEATAMLCPEVVQNSAGLVDGSTAYLAAFRTVEEYRGKGYFSQLFTYLLEDLKKRGFTRVTLGVEPSQERNKAIYAHFGFTQLVKRGWETYPDGTAIPVEYYQRLL